jgi:hypothetical protein
MGVSEFAHDLNMKWRASMAKRNVNAIIVVIGFRKKFTDLLKMLINNSHAYLAQPYLAPQDKNTGEQSDFPPDTYYYGEKIPDEPIPDKVKNKILEEFITDLASIKKIKGNLWSAIKGVDLTHGVVFFYLSAKSLIDLKSCIKNGKDMIENKESGYTKYAISEEDKRILDKFTDSELDKIMCKLENGEPNKYYTKKYHEQYSGHLIGAAKIFDGVEEFEGSTSNAIYKSWIRLDPTLINIQFFAKPIPHSSLKEINLSDEDGEEKPFGIFSGRPKSLTTKNVNVATEILEKIEERGNRLDPWLEDTKFGSTPFEGLGMESGTWSTLHKNKRIFDQIDDDYPLNEQQVRSYFLNYAVDDLGVKESHVNRVAEVYTPKDKTLSWDKLDSLKSTINLRKDTYRADYFIRISDIYVPLEAKIDIGDGSEVLSQIKRYANIVGFYRRNYDVATNKLTL